MSLDFQLIEARYKAGRSLVRLWQEARTENEHRSGYTAFCRARREWLTRPRVEIAEPEPPKSSPEPPQVLHGVLYLEGLGTGLAVRGGRLIVSGRFGKLGMNPSNHRLHCVILAAHGFTTTDALVWLVREHVAVFIAFEGEFLAMTNATAGQLARRELAIRQRQMECVLDPARRLIAARSLVAAKIGTLRFDPAVQRAFIRKLAS